MGLVTRRTRRALSAGAWLALALGAGFLAQSRARDEALGEWFDAHLPSRAAWLSELGPLGYVEEAPGKSMTRALHALPSTTDDGGAIWASSDSHWLAVFPADASAPLVFHQKGAGQPSGWSPLGRSWPGFDAAIDAARKARPARALAPIWHDPREIRY